MAILTSSTFLTPSCDFTFNSNSLSQLYSNHVKYKRVQVSAAAYATSTGHDTETIRSVRNTTLYDVLGVRVGADTREVKSAYRKLARVLHPDVARSNDSSADEFMKIHSAYTTLSDPEKRADYDRTLFFIQRRTRGSSPVRSATAYKSRRWETDQCW